MSFVTLNKILRSSWYHFSFKIIYWRLFALFLAFSPWHANFYQLPNERISISLLGRPNCVLHAYVAVELYVLAINNIVWSLTWDMCVPDSRIKGVSSIFYFNFLWWNSIDFVFFCQNSQHSTVEYHNKELIVIVREWQTCSTHICMV